MHWNAYGVFVASTLHVEIVRNIAQSMISKHVGFVCFIWGSYVASPPREHISEKKHTQQKETRIALNLNWIFQTNVCFIYILIELLGEVFQKRIIFSLELP